MLVRLTCLLCCIGSTLPALGQVDALQYKPITVLPVPLRPIVEPPSVPADQATIGENELVIGVEINGEARAYPINQLTGPMREIINDRLGGSAIAATW